RPQARLLVLRPRARDVCRPRRRGGRSAPPARGAASLHPGADALPAEPRRGPPPAADPVPRSGLGALMLAVSNLNVVYGIGRLQVDAVRDVSFSVEPGGAFGLVGESGSGKSTVLRAICGLAPVAGGRIAVDGRPVPTPRGKAFARTVQMVFQDP